jgi:type II secretory pathway component PulJ
MNTCTLTGALVVSCLLTCTPAASAADDATLFRVFLKDGSSLVSYGEVARVDDRVVFSMPIGTGSSPSLRLINIAADRVDWDRTDRYAASARSGRYIETQAEIDYTELSNRMAAALNEVGRTSDVAKRLDIVQQARKSLAEWPQTHYNYRDVDIRQLLTMLDEAIADLRVSTGGGRFDLNLVAFSSPPPPIEPLLPAPTLREGIEQMLSAARLTESSSDRRWLLTAALDELSSGEAALPSEFVSATSVAARREIETEGRIDRTYQSLTRRMMRLADQRARAADVRGVERVMTRIHQRDSAFGRARPDAVNALIAAVEDKLDAARRLRLARDRWALRAPALARYRFAIGSTMDLFAQLRPALQDIKSLSGSSPSALAGVERLVARIVKRASAISPPEELSAAHAVFVSAAHLAENAASIRREATLSNSLERAWDASSAAAGALMLGARARSDIQTLLRRPQLR